MQRLKGYGVQSNHNMTTLEEILNYLLFQGNSIQGNYASKDCVKYKGVIGKELISCEG